MNYESLKSVWLEEEQNAFLGWDFSHIQSRWRHSPLDWDYNAIVKERLNAFDQLLDMGTGGGEVLLSLNHPYELTSVTESWPPNISLCLEKLAPLGIHVYPAQEDAPLPIADDSFDIVINRHESYDLREVRRVLKPGGTFITQQVGSENCARLEERLNYEKPVHQAFSLTTEKPKFQAFGFSVEYANECFPRLTLFDVGAIVFWAKNVIWSFPDFSVERNFDRLCSLQEEIAQNGSVQDTEHRFVLAAKNMK